ncbi:MAG: hypothetical protein MK033_04355 [Candidatus Caenarcaniphilales bacterium]|nr:hypothetical protein [Candidatus Caenarcaniphilales bacterium]
MNIDFELAYLINVGIPVIFCVLAVLIAIFNFDYRARKQMGTLDPKKSFLENFFAPN